MSIGFAQALLVFGALLAAASVLSGWLRSTVLSVSVLALVSGMGLAQLGILQVTPSSDYLIEVIELALILTLLSDGMRIEQAHLANSWGSSARAIVIGMPLTMIFTAAAAKLLFGELSWVAAFLLGAVLSPTDPVLTSAVLLSQKIPARVRDTLRLESGLNDGLALPLVLLFLAVSTAAASLSSTSSEALGLVGEAGGGLLIGAGLGWGGGWLLAHAPSAGITAKYEGLYAFGLGLVAFGLSELTIGNGLIAAFACGLALAAADYEVPEGSISFTRSASSIFQILTIVLFGALIINTDYTGKLFHLILFIAATLLVARPLAVLISFVRTELSLPERWFIGWFGPKGVASMLFALFVLGSGAPHSELVFDVSSFVILTSILAHGLSDKIGIEWLAKRSEAPAAGEPGSLAHSGVERVPEREFL